MIQNFSYGKSGGQGISPLIVVTAPTGSTVTCDGVQGTEVSGTWTFPVIIGTHTIVATQGSSTKTQSVVVDQVAVFNVTITYTTYLYNEGDECTALTGGWTLTNFYSASSIVSGTKNTDNLQVQRTGTSASLWRKKGFATGLINLNEYSVLKFKAKGSIVNYVRAYLAIASSLSDSSNTNKLSYHVDFTEINSASEQIYTLDLSDISTSNYIVFYIALGNASSGTTTFNLYQAWFE